MPLTKQRFKYLGCVNTTDMATNKSNVTLTGLSRRFVEDGLLDEATAKEAFIHASQNRIPLITYLTQNNLADSKKLAFSAAMEFGVSVIDLDAFLPEMLPEKLVDEKLIRKHHALPLLKGATAYSLQYPIQRISRHLMRSSSIPA